MIQLGNTNSLVDSIYYYLWYKDDSIKDGIYKIRIPDTIIFKYGRLHQWYFTSSKGDILLKKEESRTEENIMNTLCTDNYEGKVVASYIYPDKYNYYANHHHQAYVMQNERKKELQFLDVDEKICIFYMTKELLLNFLRDKSKPPEGILQKFIEPYGEKETLIQAAWSPSVCILSRQQNYRFLQDKRYDPYERCVTFDGAEVFSRAVPIRGKEISQSIRSQVKMVVDKITNISYEKINISRVVMYFKSDKNNCMWFLYASCLRTSDEDKDQVASYRKNHLQWKNNPCKKQNNTPIAMANNYAKPYNVKLQQTTNTIHPATLIKDILCYDCNQLCQQQDLFETNFASIISTFARDPDSNPLENPNIPIMQIDSVSKPPLISRVFIDTTTDTERRLQFISSDKKDHFLRDLHSHIPPLIRKIYPNLTLDVYESLTQNDRFLAKTIYLCEDCLLKYSQTNKITQGTAADMRFQKRSLASKTNIMQNQDIKVIVKQMNTDLTKERKKVQTRSHISMTFSEQNLNSIRQSNSVITIHTLVPLLNTLMIDKQKDDGFTNKHSYNRSYSSKRTLKKCTNQTDIDSIEGYSVKGKRPSTAKTMNKINSFQNNNMNPKTTDSLRNEQNKYIETNGDVTQKKNVDFLNYYLKISNQQEMDADNTKDIQNAWTKTNTQNLNQIQ